MKHFYISLSIWLWLAVKILPNHILYFRTRLIMDSQLLLLISASIRLFRGQVLVTIYLLMVRFTCKSLRPEEKEKICLALIYKLISLLNNFKFWMVCFLWWVKPTIHCVLLKLIIKIQHQRNAAQRLDRALQK